LGDGKGGRTINLRKTATIVGAWIVLALVVWSVFGAYGEYRASVGSGSQSGRSVDQTAAAEASGTVAGGEGTDTPGGVAPVVIVLAEGLNLREKPETGSTIIKKLKKGTALALVEKVTGWYKVRDAEGDEGWIAAGGQYSKLSE
jgi:uncharacterized protein YgiM (DUF1202 family)